MYPSNPSGISGPMVSSISRSKREVTFALSSRPAALACLMNLARDSPQRFVTTISGLSAIIRGMFLRKIRIAKFNPLLGDNLYIGF